ncbi:E3 ubiquitin-protein ligase TTC3-like, partial [Discoglossus pictus]
GHDTLLEKPHITNVGKVDPLNYWLSHSREVLRENCDVIKIFMMWPTFKKDPVNSEPPWIVECSDLTVKDLSYIEILEDLVDNVKKVADQRTYIEGLLRIGDNMRKARQKNKVFYLSDAINWIKSVGNINVYKKVEEMQCVCAPILQAFFIDYSHYITWMAEQQTTLVFVFKNHFCSSCALEAEALKICGNQEFAKGHYSLALELYSKAIEFSSDNHLLFGNRALCFIRMGKYK